MPRKLKRKREEREQKQIYETCTISSRNSWQLAWSFTGPIQGVGRNNRVGKSIIVKRIRIRGYCGGNAVVQISQRIFRLVFLVDRQWDRDASPDAFRKYIADEDNLFSPFNFDRVDSITVIVDETYVEKLEAVYYIPPNFNYPFGVEINFETSVYPLSNIQGVLKTPITDIPTAGQVISGTGLDQWLTHHGTYGTTGTLDGFPAPVVLVDTVTGPAISSNTGVLEINSMTNIPAKDNPIEINDIHLDFNNIGTIKLPNWGQKVTLPSKQLIDHWIDCEIVIDYDQEGRAVKNDLVLLSCDAEPSLVHIEGYARLMIEVIFEDNYP